MNFNHHVYYDETSPTCLRWNVKSGKVNIGDVAGSLAADGYYQIKINYKVYKTHKIILNLHGVSTDDLVVDHINGNPLDNRFLNLRAVIQEINAQNKHKVRSNLGLMGVNKVILKKLEYIRCYWVGLDGKTKTKHFSVKEHGFEQAKSMAIKHRNEELNRLNSQGKAYGEGHFNG